MYEIVYVLQSVCTGGLVEYPIYNLTLEMSHAIQISCIGGLVACSIWNPIVDM